MGACVVLTCVSARGSPWALAAVRSLFCVVMEIPEDGKVLFTEVVFLHLESAFLPWTLRAVSGVQMFLAVRQAKLSFRLCV